MRNRYKTKKYRKRKNGKIIIITTLMIVLILFGIFLIKTFSAPTFEDINTNSAERKISKYASEHNFSINDYPESLVELFAQNPDTEEFVLNYPQYKDNRFTDSLDEYANCTSVPLLMQWDTRWGYTPYGNDIMGITGCGPTCLSMVALYILGDTSMTPSWMVQYSTDNGYCVPGNGTSWSLMLDGAKDLGFDAKELPLDENQIINNLEEGNPIICIMGPGNFTSSGHFIVLTGYKDGKLVVNDPNSYKNSEKLWALDDIKGQIKNLWVYRK